MRILGIDPGSLIVGYGCLELGEAKPSVSPHSHSLSQAQAPAQALPLAHRVANMAKARPGHARLLVLDSGVLRLGPSKRPIEERLHSLAEGLRELLVRLRPQELALEEAFFGKSVQSALRIGEARGVILAEASRAGVRVQQFSPARIKRSVTGRGSASKVQVARMVARLLGLDDVPHPADVADALAVCLCSVAQK